MSTFKNGSIVISPKATPVTPTLAGEVSIVARNSRLFGYDGTTENQIANIADVASVSGSLLLQINNETLARIAADAALTSNITSISGSLQTQINNIPSNRDIAESLSCGLISGGILSINVDNTKFNVSAGKGVIVDDWTDPNVPVVYDVSWTTQTAIPATYIGTNSVTWVGIDNSGSVYQFNSNNKPTNDVTRNYIILGKLAHYNLTSIATISPRYDVFASPINQYYDYLDTFNLINVGIYPYANGSNLNFNITAGKIFGKGINYSSNMKDPHTKLQLAQIPVTFQYRLQNGTSYANRTTIDPANYDVGGTLTAIPGGGNTSTNQRVYLFSTGNIRIQYGQQTYSSISNAVAGISNEVFNTYSAIADDAVLIGILSVRKGASDLSNITHGIFTTMGRFGDTASGSSGTSTATLQSAYNNSTEPEIITNATLDGVSIRVGSDQTNSANALTIQNIAGTIVSSFNGLGSITSAAISGNANNLVAHDINGKLIDSGISVASITGSYVLKAGDTMTGNLGIGVTPSANLSLYNSGNSGNLVVADFATAYNGLAAQLICGVGSNQNLVGFNFPGLSSGALNWFTIRFNASGSKTWWGCYASPSNTSLTHQQTPTQSYVWTTNLGIPSSTLSAPHMVLYTPSTASNGITQGDAQLGINTGYVPAGTLDVIAAWADSITISGSGNTLVGTTITLNTTTPHNLQTGATVQVNFIVSSIPPTNSWNGSFVITVLSPYSFSYTNPSATGTYVSGPGSIYPATRTSAIKTSNGILNIGPATTSFDGVTSGNFKGSVGGTYLAMNTSSVFVGNFIDVQKNGVSKYIIDSLGTTIVPSVSGVGIKVDTVNPTYGWRDITGQIIPDTGPTAPTKGAFRGGTIGMYSFTDGDQCDIPFHVPHDYALGTNIFVHVHWSHNGTSISNNAVFTLTATTAKGFNQAIYSAEKAQTITYNTVNIATTPRYIHRIDEIQLSNNGGTGNLLDTNAIEVDSLILLNFTMTTNPSIGGGSPNEVYVMQIDLHYQSTGIPTKNKSPNFYGTTS